MIWSNETWFGITSVNLMRARHTLVIWISQLLLLLAWNLFAVVSSNNEKTRHDVHSYTEVELGNDTVEALFIFRYSQMYTQIQCAAHTFTLAHIYAHTEQMNTLYIIRTVSLFWYTHSLSLDFVTERTTDMFTSDTVINRLPTNRLLSMHVYSFGKCWFWTFILYFQLL